MSNSDSNPVWDKATAFKAYTDEYVRLKQNNVTVKELLREAIRIRDGEWNPARPPLPVSEFMEKLEQERKEQQEKELRKAAEASQSKGAPKSTEKEDKKQKAVVEPVSRSKTTQSTSSPAETTSSEPSEKDKETPSSTESSSSSSSSSSLSSSAPTPKQTSSGAPGIPPSKADVVRRVLTREIEYYKELHASMQQCGFINYAVLAKKIAELDEAALQHANLLSECEQMIPATIASRSFTHPECNAELAENAIEVAVLGVFALKEKETYVLTLSPDTDDADEKSLSLFLFLFFLCSILLFLFS